MMKHKEKRPHNTGLAKVAVQCSLPVPVQAGAGTFVVNHPPLADSASIRQSAEGENRHLRQAREPLMKIKKDETNTYNCNNGLHSSKRFFTIKFNN
jgi:hypothetical protein